MRPLWLPALIAIVFVAACERRGDDKKSSGPPPTLITVVQVKTDTFELTEDTLGTLEAVADPKLGAEVAGKVVQVLAFTGKMVKRGDALARIEATDLQLQNQAEAAEVRRLEALLAQQEKLVERQQQLIARGFISPNAGDDVKAQRAALAEQLAGARARFEAGRRSVGKTTVAAPFDGVIENQFVATGDYLKIGDPMFQLVSNRVLRAHLPFPEAAASRLTRGQSVRLASPLAPEKTFMAKIADIRPSVNESSRALDVIVDLDNADGALKAGGTVNAAVLIAAKEGALTVPEQSVVLRPAGRVVYVVADGKARQRVVQAGGRRDGRVEILSGLNPGETVARDGAGFLTDGAAVTIKDTAAAGDRAERPLNDGKAE